MNADDDRWEHSDHGCSAMPSSRISSICSQGMTRWAKLSSCERGDRLSARARRFRQLRSTAERTGPEHRANTPAA